jgi:hypothetical protein
MGKPFAGTGTQHGSGPYSYVAKGWLKGAVMDLEHYLAKMREYERIAEQSRDPMVRQNYLDWLRQLRELSIDAAMRQPPKGL